MKNKQICENFVKGIRTQKTKHLFIEPSTFNPNNQSVLIIYSYGYHYPLGIKLIDNTFIVNNSRYSNTTARHKSLLVNAIGNNKDILFFDTQKLNDILFKGLLTKSQIIEDKI
jgi:hypothetical protein